MASNDNSNEPLIALEKLFIQFEIKANFKELETLLTAEFYQYASSGKIISRTETLNRKIIDDGKTKIEANSFKVIPLGNEVALITYIAKKINSDGSTMQYLRSSVWKKNNENKWQIEFHQGTNKIF